MYTILSRNTTSLTLEMNTPLFEKFLEYIAFDENNIETYQLHDAEGIEPGDLLDSYRDRYGKRSREISA